MKRAIQSKIEDSLSEAMLRGDVTAGGHYVCEPENDAFVFRKTDTAAEKSE